MPHHCTGDCSKCAALELQSILSKGKGLSRKVAIRLQDTFDRQALGLTATASEYTTPLVRQEMSFKLMAKNVTGCQRIEDDTRMLAQTMLSHTRLLLDQKIEMDERQYKNDGGVDF